MADRPVAVVIAAYAAETTVGNAIASALAEPEVGEVVVVDDASPDATAGAARAADDGSGRLRVIVQPANAGPSAARNRGIAESRSPLLAVLDADDLILPGRFGAMLAIDDWDLIADNIAFVPEGADITGLAERLTAGKRDRAIGLPEFVERNISRRGRLRSELGFLKPLISRAFLDRHALRYDEGLRLGEDFALYARALALGARFRLSENCGYLAFQREASLSGRHRTADLRALRDSSRALALDGRLDRGARSIVGAHARALDIKFRHRALLDDKAALGAPAAIARLLSHPGAAWPVLRAVWDDKRAPPPPPLPPLRLLFGPEEFTGGDR